jgi:hypothetical protein
MSSNAKTTTRESIIDVFGRDNSLRKQQTPAPNVSGAYDDMLSTYAYDASRFKGMSWAEITFLAEEEEEEELRKKDEELKKKDAERKKICETTATYDLEDGEIFE